MWMTIGLLVSLAAICPGQAYNVRIPIIETPGKDLPVTFGEAAKCSYRSSYSYYSRYYNKHYFQNTYTARDTMDCCYRDNTRNMCCLHTFTVNKLYRTQCLCHPDVTCHSGTPCPPQTPPPTTPPPTTPPPTTPPPTTPDPFLCPPYARPQPEDRALNGLPVSDTCRYKGVVRIAIATDTSTPVLCQAVHARTAVNGVNTDVLVTVDRCVDTVTFGLNNGVRFKVVYGNKEYSLDRNTFGFISGSNGRALFIPRTALVDQRPCQYAACAYTPNMPALNTLTDCKLVSYGSVQELGGYAGLQEVPVALSPGGCVDQRDSNTASNSLCFASKSGLNIYCGGDLGAPVYCTLPNTQEVVYIGNSFGPQQCNTVNNVLVSPYQP